MSTDSRVGRRSGGPARQPRLLGVGLAACLAGALALPAPRAVAQSGAVPGIGQTARGDEYLIVDCLLPSQVRRLGSRLTFLAPRRAEKSSARDCEIRGGEYVNYDRANYATALKVWLSPAEQGDPVAQTYVGEIYEKGLGVAPDHAVAAQWYRRAAEKGSSRAALNLGALYERGLGVPADPREAAAWYRRASGLPGLGFETAAEGRPEEIKRLETEVQRLQRELASKQAELDRTEQESAALRQREAEAAAERAKIERLRRERSQVDPGDSAAGARLQRAIDDGEARIQAAEREIAALQEKLGRTQAAGRAAAGRAAEVARLREQLAEARARVDLQRAGVEQLRKERDRGAPEVELVRAQVVEPEMLATMRAGGAAAGENPLPVLLLAGRVRSPAGVKSLTINSREESLDEQGLFRTRLIIRDTADPVVRIVAIDRNDQRAALEVTPPRRTGTPVAPVAAPGPESIQRLRASLGKYHALVIGNDRYASFRPLRTAANDARAVAAVLRERYGFEVTLLENATRGQTLAELNRLRQRLTDRDNLLIYYAGHGDLDEQTQQGHWLPVDAQPGAPATWLPNTDLSDILNAIAVRHLLVVADSCYAATLTQSSTGRREPGSGASELVKTVEGLASRRARMVMTSGGIEPVADAAGGAHSAFAQIFVGALRTNEGTLLGRDLFGRLQIRVYDLAQRWAISQVPEYAPIKYAGHEGGDFFFVRAP
jgi:hypothetical protein